VQEALALESARGAPLGRPQRRAAVTMLIGQPLDGGTSMAMVQHSIQQSHAVWLEILVLALVVVVVALALTLIFNGPSTPNSYNLTIDPGAALYSW
jgi:hypothetical protein